MATRDLSLVEQANIVTDEIVIPPKLYNSLIGTRGKLILSIVEDCGGVAIKFPTAESHSDKVSIRGPKDDVEKAKQQLLQLSNEKLLSSFSAEVRAKAQHHKFLIGKNGANIKKIRESTRARIIFPTEKDEDKEVITIIGKQDAVDTAKAELESAIQKVLRAQSHSTSEENTTETEISIDAKHHGHFLSRRGEVLHRIIQDCGGVLISFPHTINDGDRVVIKGALDSVKAAKQRLLDIVRELESMVTIECEIPRRHRRAVIGAKGSKVQAINAEFKVQIRFPDRFPQEEWRSDKQGNDEEVEATDILTAYDIVRIIGQSDNAEAAKQALLNLVPITIEVAVPNYLHRSIIGQRGRDVRELMEKYDVHIVLSRADQNLDYITITGTQAHIEEAKEAILEKCKKMASKSFELKIEVDSEYHPKIIGRSGAVIKKISFDNDVAINFPHIGDPEDSLITITGYEKNVHSARDDILKIINEVEQRYTVVLAQVPETQDKQSEIIICESPNPPMHTEIIGCKTTEVEKSFRDMSNIHKESTDPEDEIKISHPTEEVDKVQTEMQMLSKKLNVSCNSMSLIQEHTNVIRDALKYCEDSKDRLAELYTNVTLKQERKMKELQDHLNDQVSMNKALKVERTQLILEINSEREECEIIIHANQQKYAEGMTKMSDTIEDIKANLKMEQEEKSKLVAENDESSTRFKDLLSKHEALQVTSAEHQKRLEFLLSGIKSSNEKEIQPNEKLNALKHTHHAVISDENFESAHYSQQLQDLAMMNTGATDTLTEVTSNNEELSNASTKRVEDNNRLTNVLQNKNDEILKLNIHLHDALKNNRKSSTIIQSLNQDLITAEERICQAQTEFKTYRDNVDEHVMRQKTNHEDKLNRIKFNVYDLKEKLMEITQDIHNSSEICGMLNEAQNPSNLLPANSDVATTKTNEKLLN